MSDKPTPIAHAVKVKPTAEDLHRLAAAMHGPTAPTEKDLYLLADAVRKWLSSTNDVVPLGHIKSLRFSWRGSSTLVAAKRSKATEYRLDSALLLVRDDATGLWFGDVDDTLPVSTGAIRTRQYSGIRAMADAVLRSWGTRSRNLYIRDLASVANTGYQYLVDKRLFGGGTDAGADDTA